MSDSKIVSVCSRATLHGLLALACLTTAAEAAPQDNPNLQVLKGRSDHLVAPWPVKGVSLTDPEIADVEVVSPTLLLIRGKAQGSTDVTLWDERGETFVQGIDVQLSLAPIERQLESMFPGCVIEVEQTNNVLVVTGTLDHADQAPQLRTYLDALSIEYVDMTTLPGIQQVQVKVRIAEVSRAGVRSLGVNAFATGSDAFGGSTIGPSTGGALNPVSIGPAGGTIADDNVPFSFNQDVNVSPAITLFGGFPNANLEFFIQALAENQYLRILAEPALVALSGEEASFLAGGEFPIPVVQGGGVGGTAITIDYKEFGIALHFRPIVLGGGGIRMDVLAEVSELTDIGSVQIQGFQVPAVNARRVDTTLEMKSGQTFAMAGLISEEANATVAKTPGLGSIPILGTMFRSVRYRRGETELLVLVTASLVEPLSKVNLPPSPGMTHIVPSDWELYVQGRIEGKAPARIAPDSAEWLRDLGLDGLQGPGAWARHDQRTAVGTADSAPPAITH